VHGAKVGWDIGPQIALGYLFAAIILAGFGLLTRGQKVELASDEEIEAAIDEGTPVDGGDPVVSTDGVPVEATVDSPVEDPVEGTVEGTVEATVAVPAEAPAAPVSTVESPATAETV
jgi:hypothetical protein